MPIPVITDGIQAPQIQGPLDTYAKGVQLKSLLQGQQLQQQQITGAQQENQLHALQIQDEYGLRNSSKGLDWTKPDTFSKFLQNAQENGVSPKTLSQLSLQRAQYQEQLAKTDTATLGADQTRTNLLLGHIDAIKKDPTSAPAQASQILNAGLVKDPNMMQMLQAVAQGQKVPTQQELTTFEDGLTDHKTQIEQQFKERETTAKEQEAQARVTTAQNTSQRLQAEMPGGAMQPVEQKELSDYMAKNPGKGPVDFAKFKASLAPQAQVNVQMGANGPQADALVDAVGQNKMKIADAIPMRAPVQVRQAFLGKVLAKYPDFNSANYDVEKGVMKDFTSGASAKNLTAFNTAIDHAGQLDKAVDALKNGDMRLLNKIGNEAGYQFGNNATTNFNVIKNALSGEISKVFKGGQATDAEIHAVQAPFDTANSPAQLKGAIKQAISLMNSKRDALKQQYAAGSQAKPNFGNEPSAVTGQTATGPNGHKIMVKDGKWVDAQTGVPVQ